MLQPLPIILPGYTFTTWSMLWLSIRSQPVTTDYLLKYWPSSLKNCCPFAYCRMYLATSATPSLSHLFPWTFKLLSMEYLRNSFSKQIGTNGQQFIWCNWIPDYMRRKTCNFSCFRRTSITRTPQLVVVPRIQIQKFLCMDRGSTFRKNPADPSCHTTPWSLTLLTSSQPLTLPLQS